MKTGNTSASDEHLRYVVQPQWSPAMKTGNTGRLIITIPPQEGSLNGARP